MLVAKRMMAISLTLVCSLAGCTEPATDSDGPKIEGPTAQDGPPAENPSKAAPPPAEPPMDVHFNECDSLGATVHFPADTAPGDTPEGWQDDYTQTDSHVSYEVMICSRFAHGTTEYTDIGLIWETHTNFAKRNNCTSLDGYPAADIVATAYVSDPALAQYMSGVLGLPAIASNISMETDQVGDLQIRTVKWSVDPHPASSLVFRSQPDDVNGRSDWESIAVFEAEPIGRMLGYSEYTSLLLMSFVGEGTFEPPTLLSTLDAPILPTGHGMASGMAGSFHFDFFEDLECTELSRSSH